eukprot:CAMPEP_0181185060 /NCGR_PEP_ID=MMETSP1096-20121128/9303_1 /TAXON_ID=156174 ORGANISM="Chrysochromulina ericina, Strain CCMP281" /NCGR_SAMPLE_ID=MMETSP1096 /ASSEMBLY_ACC=CAM_ASM_000453 /LENGTH=194 /DNA_ID=CAMNT_0023273873 /DNA_START=478 /DNA_END=1063 /DNA_ORIENTATION=-
MGGAGLCRACVQLWPVRNHIAKVDPAPHRPSQRRRRATITFPLAAPPRALLGNATPPLPPIGNESLEGKAEQPGQTSPQTTEMNNGRLARGSPVRGSPLRGSPLRGIPTLPTDSSRPARLMGSAARLPAPLEVDEPWRPDILNSNETGELGFRRSKQLTQVASQLDGLQQKPRTPKLFVRKSGSAWTPPTPRPS